MGWNARRVENSFFLKSFLFMSLAPLDNLEFSFVAEKIYFSSTGPWQLRNLKDLLAKQLSETRVKKDPAADENRADSMSHRIIVT